MRHLELGQWGEEQATRFLKKQGFKILGRNVRFGPREELDVVARDGDSLVFVEVKARSSETYGRPIAAVDRDKRAALSRAAVHYLRKIRFPQVTFRFDVVEVVGELGQEAKAIRHIPNAFTLDARYRLPY